MVHEGSSITAWLSGGHTADAVGWHGTPVGTVADGVGVPGAAVRPVHLYLTVDVDGANGWLDVCA